MKQHSEHRGVKIYTDAKGHFTSKFGEHLTLLKCIEKIDHRLDYKPKNYWHYKGEINKCFTDEQFEELEENYTFSLEVIVLNTIGFDLWGNFHFDFIFKGIQTNGINKDGIEDEMGNIIKVTEENYDFLLFEHCKNLFAEDTMNDIYENYKEYLEK